MKTKINIDPKNENDEFHGYQEWYLNDGTVGARSTCKNGLYVGYHEFHVMVLATEFFIR
jgi:hypothetical protein